MPSSENLQFEFNNFQDQKQRQRLIEMAFKRDFSINKKVVTNPWVYGSAIFVLVCTLAFAVWLVFFKKKWIVLQFEFRKKGSNSKKSTVQANKTTTDPKNEVHSKKSSEKANEAHEDSKNEPHQNKSSEETKTLDKEKASIGAENSSQGDTTSNSQKDSQS
jgi:hypothetical protein